MGKRYRFLFDLGKDDDGREFLRVIHDKENYYEDFYVDNKGRISTDGSNFTTDIHKDFNKAFADVMLYSIGKRIISFNSKTNTGRCLSYMRYKRRYTSIDFIINKKKIPDTCKVTILEYKSRIEINIED